TPGNVGVGTMHGPPQRRLDIAVSKSLRVSEKQTVQIRVESYNVTNTQAFSRRTEILVRRRLAVFPVREMHLRGKCNSGSSICSDLEPRLQSGKANSTKGLGLSSSGKAISWLPC